MVWSASVHDHDRLLTKINNLRDSDNFSCVKTRRRMRTRGIEWSLRAREQCVYFCEQEQWSNFSCEQRLKKITMARNEHFVNFPPGGISLLLKGNVLCRVIWLTPFNHWSQQLQSLLQVAWREIGTLQRWTLKENFKALKPCEHIRRRS